MYKFEQNSIPLYIQLYEQMKDDIKTNLTAGIFGFSPKAAFQADAGSQNAPKVEF